MSCILNKTEIQTLHNHTLPKLRSSVDSYFTSKQSTWVNTRDFPRSRLVQVTPTEVILTTPLVLPHIRICNIRSRVSNIFFSFHWSTIFFSSEIDFCLTVTQLSVATDSDIFSSSSYCLHFQFRSKAGCYASQWAGKWRAVVPTILKLQDFPPQFLVLIVTL